jgi:hypothetical protein
MALTFLYTSAFVAAVNTLALAAIPADVQTGGQFGLSLPVSPLVAGVLMLVALLFGTAVFVATARALARPPEERGSLSGDLFTRRMGRAVGSAVGANLVVVPLVMVGFVFLFVPGLFIAVSFVFVVFAVAVEDARAVGSLRRSWGLASGNRWRLFGLVFLLGIASGTASGVGTVVSTTAPVAGQVATLALTAIVSVLGYGVLADAFVQLRRDTAG